MYAKYQIKTLLVKKTNVDKVKDIFEMCCQAEAVDANMALFRTGRIDFLLTNDEDDQEDDGVLPAEPVGAYSNEH